MCVCVCLSVYLYSRTTGNEAARERYTHLWRNKRSKNNVADLAKTATFWQEKPAPPSFCDPTHQLARCAHVFNTCLGACSTGSAPEAELPGVLHCCKCYFKCHQPVSELLYLLPGYVTIYCMAPVAVVVFASFLPVQLQSCTQNVFAPRVCTLVLFISVSNTLSYNCLWVHFSAILCVQVLYVTIHARKWYTSAKIF